MKKFDIITIFPQIFDSYFNESILKRAQKNKLIEINIHDLRQWTEDNHRSVDDKPYGGGPGMVMMVEPIFKAARYLKESGSKNKESVIKKRRVIIFSAKGKQFSQADARRLAKYDQLIFICGRYEGVDERVAQNIADEEISVGNFVLTGGEIPAMILVDVISRLIPGVLGKEESLKEESFDKEGNIEYPQYTRPDNFQGWKVPKVLLSGNHDKIKKWREKMSQKIINK